MRIDHRKIIVVDVESTCWQQVSDKPPGAMSQIIEIGAAVLDTKTMGIKSLDRMIIRPVGWGIGKTELSDFCVELTGITTEQVDKGMSLNEACTNLIATAGSESHPWASYGDYDRKMFEQDCPVARTRYPFSPRHLNVKALFATCNALTAEVGLGAALKQAGMNFEGQQHNGQDDAKNIAALLAKMIGGFRL